MVAMRTSPRALTTVFGLAALLSACKTPGPRIPFDTGRGWMAFVSGSERGTNDRYIHSYTPVGIEVITLAPGTSGWGWEVSLRYGEDTGDDKERKQVRSTFSTPSAHNQRNNVSVQTERESKLYEFSAGVRQVYWEGARVQPFFGVGASLFRIENEDDLSGTYTIVDLEDGDESFDYVPLDEDSKEWSFGLYLRSGFTWRVTGSPDGDRLSLFLASDVRAFTGYEFDYLELNVGLGIGR
jgi:hypothetical protein